MGPWAVHAVGTGALGKMARPEGRGRVNFPSGYLGFRVLPARHLDRRDVKQGAGVEGRLGWLTRRRTDRGECVPVT